MAFVWVVVILESGGYLLVCLEPCRGNRSRSESHAVIGYIHNWLYRKDSL